MKTTTTLLCVCLLQQFALLLAAPSIEACPRDSIQVEDTCKCNPQSCSKPPCLHTLEVASNGTGTPGSCCPIYSCEGCSNDTLLEGKCPCAPDAVLNDKNQCQCTDPFKSLLEDECICNEDLCSLPEMCLPHQVSVFEKRGCCTHTACIDCPSDSFPMKYDDVAIENKCVCYPCEPAECGPNEKVIINQSAKNFPGHCCEMYTCERRGEEESCTVNGVDYTENQVWNTTDGWCRCTHGIAFCSRWENEEGANSCLQESTIYRHDESWNADGCTNCTCIDGIVKCIAHFCESHESQTKKPECPPFNCSKTCPEGFKMGKRGCKLCKCNAPSRYDDLLHKYNITTKTQLNDILENYFAPGKEDIETTTVRNISVVNTTNEFSETSGKCISPWIYGVLLMGVLVLCLVGFFSYRYLYHWTRGSYDTNPSTKNYQHAKLNTDDSLLQNNNYISKSNKGKILMY